MSAEAPPEGASTSERDDTAGDDTRRRRWALVLIAAAFLLVWLGTVGVLYDGNLVWLNHLAHPFIFGCVAAGSFGVGVCQLISIRWLRILVGVATTAVGGAWFVIGFLWVTIVGMSPFPVAMADAPGDREYKAVVYEQPDWIDTVWYVYIRQTHGPLSRQWRAGCISNDLTADPAIQDLIWQSPSRLFVSTGGMGVTILVDPRTGKPQSPIPQTARTGC